MTNNMEGTFKWGIIGIGHIANSFAKAVDIIEGAKVFAVASRSLSRAKEFAEKYLAFMTRVNTLSDQEDLEEFLQSQTTSDYKDPNKYFMASKGASTDEPQRKERTSLLKDCLLG